MNKFEKMYDRLPDNIKNSDLLSLQSKKTLAALLELLLHSKANSTGVIYTTNKMLRRLAGINSNNLLDALNELKDYDLITRKVGAGYGNASEYTINVSILKKPLVKKGFDELFNKFM